MIVFMFQIISNIAHFCCIIIIVIINSLLLLLLLSEVLGPKDLPVEASLQTWKYFDPGSQAILSSV